MKFGEPTLAPTQWIEFTLHADSVDLFLQEGEIGTLDDLNTINQQINQDIQPLADVQISDPWTLYPKQGRCGDYALTKRHELLLAGWPSSALLLAEVIIGDGQHHAVLLARIDEEWVLDNRVSVLRHPKLTGYKWLKIQNPENPMFWIECS